MATVPMQEDVGQEIYTRDHGVVKVDKKSWIDGGYHIVLSPNGTYQHITGLPIKNEKELIAAFGSNKEDLERAIHWFRNRHDQEGKAPRPISMHPDGHPVFDDGTVPDFDDLYAYFRPGKGLTGMIVALQDYKDHHGSQTAPKELRKAAPEPPSEMAPPVHDPEKYSPRARGQAKEKASGNKSAKSKRSTPIHTPG